MSGNTLVWTGALLIGAVMLLPNGAREAATPAPATVRKPPISPAAPARAFASHELRRSADGHFYAEAEVNGARVRFLVDTGATHIVLSPRDAKRVAAELDHRRRAASLRTAGGSAPMHWAMLGHVGIGDRTEQSVRAVVASDQTAVPVSLMGQNMLSRLSSLTIEGDRLTLR